MAQSQHHSAKIIVTHHLHGLQNGPPQLEMHAVIPHILSDLKHDFEFVLLIMFLDLFVWL